MNSMASHRWANACDPSCWENRRRPASLEESLPADQLGSPSQVPYQAPALLDTRFTIANVGVGHLTSSSYSSSDNTSDEPNPGFTFGPSREPQHPSRHLPTTQPFGHSPERWLPPDTQTPHSTYPPHAHGPRILYPRYNFLAQPNMQYHNGELPCFCPQSGYKYCPQMGPGPSHFPQLPNAQHAGLGIATPFHPFQQDPWQMMQQAAFAAGPAPMPIAMQRFFEPHQSTSSHNPPAAQQPNFVAAPHDQTQTVSPEARHHFTNSPLIPEAAAAHDQTRTGSNSRAHSGPSNSRPSTWRGMGKRRQK